MPNNRTRLAAVVAAAACPALAAPSALAASPSAAGGAFDWLTIGDAGRGGVDYEFRIMRTVVTPEQFVDFANAFKPFFPGTIVDFRLGGNNLGTVGTFEDFEFVASPSVRGTAHWNSWSNAAFFCNWLHNGRVNERWAFETGAYDMRGWDSNGLSMPAPERSAGARYWIPSFDEFKKAAYFDPTKDGGAGGFWLYPDQSDTSLIPGPASEGGQTLGQTFDPPNPGGWLLEQYPDVQSYYGLIDMSGVGNQWTETAASPGNMQALGSSSFSWGPLNDRYDLWSTGFSNGSQYAIRLATTVPAPSAVLAVLVPALAGSVLRRRP